MGPLASVLVGEVGSEGSPRPVVTWTELMAAASLAADTGMGEPLETGLGICLVALALGRRVGLSEAELRRAYHLALLQHIGCTSASEEAAEVTGDELLMRQHAATLDFSNQREMLGFILRHVARVNPVMERPLALARALAGGRKMLDTAVDVCEAGQLLGVRCGYDPHCREDLATVYENWDGSGFPGRAAGDEIPVPTRVVQVATLAVNAERLMGAEAAAALLRARRGHSLAPGVVDVFVAGPAQMFAPLASVDSLWEAVIAAEPGRGADPGAADVDTALSSLADFADLKSHYLVGHSRGVAELAAEAATRLGMAGSEVTFVRRAGYVHDIGRVAVSSAVWNKSGQLTPHEAEQVRLHPYYTNQVLARTPFLRSLGEVASCHHERLDGSGYFRGSRGSALDLPARVLAAADAYHTKIEARPYRAALDPEHAAAHLVAEADAGRLDRLAVDAVLSAVGQEAPRRPTHLTPREIEILQHVARGGSMREVARALSISPKTVDGHLQRIYPKIGVSTRAGATLYALEHGLLPSALRREVGENSP